MNRRHVNFIPPELRPKLVIPHEAVPMIMVLVFALYASGSALRLAISTHSSQKELVQVEATQAEVLQLLQKSRMLEQTNESYSSLQKVLARKNYWSEIFKELSLLIPDGLWLTSFANQKPDKADKNNTSERLILKGEASSQEGVAEFLTILEKSHHFSGARINSSEKEADIKPARYKFEFSIPVRTSTGGSG